MSGPLRRLTSRLGGEGLPRLQAMARLPFGPMPEMQTAMPQNEMRTASASPNQEWPDASPLRSPSSLQSTNETGKPDAVLETPTHPMQRATETPAQPGFPTPLVPQSAQPAKAQATAPLFSATPIRHPLPLGETPQAAALTEPEHVAPAHTSPDQTALRAETGTQSVQSWPSPLLPIKTHRESQNPARNEVSATSGNTPATPDRTVPYGLAEQAAASKPNEVHVHIGSIEVTALHEAPAPPPARARRNSPQPMSLDDYLAKRRSNA